MQACFQMGAVNNGVQDKLLNAVDQLKSAIADATNTKGLVDFQKIEKVWNVAVLSNFKPTIPLNSEYTSNNLNGGSIGFGQEVTINLLPNGDFLNDCVFHIKTNAIGFAKRAVVAGDIKSVAPEQVVLTTPTAVPQINSLPLYNNSSLQAIDIDSKLVRKFEYLGLYTDAGNVITVGDKVSDRVAYCDFPGERLFEKVELKVNENHLDEYSKYNLVFNRQFLLNPDKLNAYKQCNGQEIPIQCPTLNVSSDMRSAMTMLNGPQTPKAVQPPLELFCRADFWFCKHLSSALPVSQMVCGERTITVKLADYKDMVARYPAGYQILKSTNQYVPDLAASMVKADNKFDVTAVLDANGDLDVNKIERTFYDFHYCPFWTATQWEENMKPQVLSMQLLTHVFCSIAEVHNAFVKQTGFYLVRIHKTQQNNLLQSNQDQIELTILKNPTEFMIVGAMPQQNSGKNNAYQFNIDQPDNATCKVDFRMSDWCVFSKCDHKLINCQKGYDQAAVAFGPHDTVIYREQTPCLSELGFSSIGQEIFKHKPILFWNSYVPFNDQGSCFSSSDKGIAMMSFTHSIKSFQPNSWYNMSRANNNMLTYKSDVISTDFKCDLVVAAESMNFVVASQGQAALRFY